MILGIYCAGGLGREVLELARQIDSFEKIVFIDDGHQTDTLNGVPILSFQSFCHAFPPEQARVVLASGEPAILQSLFVKITNAGYGLQTLVHPAVSIPENCCIGQGVVVQANVFIGPNVKLADGVYLNVNCALGHDAQIGCFTNISMGCMIAGETQIGSFCYLGAGSLLREERCIGSRCIIGMGSVILKSIPDFSLAYGNPARVIRTTSKAQMVF